MVPPGICRLPEDQGNKIASITPKTGAITEIAVSTAASGPNSIIEGSYNKIWFTESNSNGIGEISK